MTDKNGNSNCLEGLQCPKCGNHEKLVIQCKAMFYVEEDGTDPIDYSEIVWDENSYTECFECAYHGPNSSFTIPVEVEKEDD